MTPRQQAQIAWEKDCTIEFSDAETHCFLYGFVISTPKLYVMAEAVPAGFTAEILELKRQNYRMTMPSPICYVWCASGNLGELMALLRTHKEFTHVAFQKKGYAIRTYQINAMGKGPPPPKPAPPPISSSNLDSLAAEDAAKKKARARYNFADTIIAAPTDKKETLG